MIKKKLLSIVVPTKNRYYYLKYIIDLVEDLKSDDVELVIQDNSDDNSDFLKYLQNSKCNFIRYDYIKEQIPMSDNSDKAILNSTGEYICFLGDDDGFTKYLLDGVRWMKQENIDAVKPAEITYSWPDAPQGKSAEIRFDVLDGKVKYKKPINELIKVLSAGIKNRGDMPLAYHAVVSRSALDKVYDIAGTFFPGNSPDISNAVALCLVVDKYAIVNAPWAYSGNSAYKGGGVFARGNSAPQINEIPWFRPNCEERWCKQVPRIASGANIWADSAIESLRIMKRSDLINKVNFYEMYANFILAMPEKADLAFSICESRFLLKLYTYFVYFKRKLLALYTKVCWALFIKKKSNNIKGIKDVKEASRFLETYYKNA